MSKRLAIIIDITGLQSEDIDLTLRTIRALHPFVIDYNTNYLVSAEDEELEKLYDNQIER